MWFNSLYIGYWFYAFKYIIGKSNLNISSSYTQNAFQWISWKKSRFKIQMLKNNTTLSIII